MEKSKKEFTTNVKTNFLLHIAEKLMSDGIDRPGQSFALNVADSTAALKMKGFLWLQYSPCPTRIYTPPKNSNSEKNVQLDDFFKIEWFNATWGIEIIIQNGRNKVNFYYSHDNNVVTRCDVTKGEAFKNWDTTNCIQKFLQLLLDGQWLDDNIVRKFTEKRMLWDNDDPSEEYFYKEI